MSNPTDPVNLNGTWWNYDPETRTHRPSYNNDSRAFTHVEPIASHEPMATRESTSFTARVSIEIVSYRARLADPAGISEKAAIDGLVNCGILRGDSLREIQEPIIHRQVKVKNVSEERTDIIIEVVK